MPIKPIDLQTLFVQLNQVGRQQAAEKDGAVLHAQLHTRLVKRIEDEASKAVQRPRDDQAAAESVDEDGGQQAPSGGSQQRKARPEETEGAPGVETVSDPALGGHVDISG